MAVRVREDRRRPTLEGMEGTVQKSYGEQAYLAVDVRLEDGQLELFWSHQLDQADIDFSTRSLPFYDGS